MKLPVSRGALALLGAALVVAALAWHAGDETVDSSASVAGGAQPIIRNRGDARVAVAQAVMPQGSLAERVDALSAREKDAADINEIFAATSLKPPPPPPAPPPKPTAPPFPYAYLGALKDGPERAVFVAGPQRVVVLRADQVVDGVYHIDRIDDTKLTVTYLPLKQQQVIAFGVAP